MAYFDNSATTAVCAAAVERMVRVMTEVYGNPSSLHTMGVRAEQEVAKARAEVAALIGAKAEQIVFTSGGTEANNLAILGAAAALRRRPPVAVTTAVEHPSVAACFDELEKQGWSVTRVSPLADGTVTPEQVAAACTADTALVSVMAVNNETGARFDIPSMVAAVKARAPQAVFHTDCVQAAGKLPLKAERWGVDLLTVSSHKLHGPKGCGALYVRKGVRLLPRVFGGGQEKGLRSGTEAVPAIVGFGAAAASVAPFEAQNAKYTALRDTLMRELSSLTEVRWHCPPDGVPYIVHLSIPGIRSETLLHFLAAKELYVSSGSACAKGKHSTVLEAMGLPPEEIDSSLRISFCYENTEDEVRALAQALRDAAETLQRRRT